jgi:asparagine synthase (glutamine-hydrolysing)
MGLVAVLATQLWHQTFIDDSLADLPSQKSIAGPHFHTRLTTTPAAR